MSEYASSIALFTIGKKTDNYFTGTFVSKDAFPPVEYCTFNASAFSCFIQGETVVNDHKIHYPMYESSLSVNS